MWLGHWRGEYRLRWDGASLCSHDAEGLVRKGHRPHETWQEQADCRGWSGLRQEPSKVEEESLCLPAPLPSNLCMRSGFQPFVSVLVPFPQAPVAATLVSFSRARVDL